MHTKRFMASALHTHHTLTLCHLHTLTSLAHSLYVTLGEDDVTSGASSDLKQATALARAMVTKYGMSSKVGQVSLDYEDDGRSMSSETRQLVEDEVRSLVQVSQSVRRGRCVRCVGVGVCLQQRQNRVAGAYGAQCKCVCARGRVLVGWARGSTVVGC